MKLTLNIDDELLGRVMDATGAKTKTEAIHSALAEIDRRHKLITLLADDFGMTNADWKDAFDESSIVPTEEEESTLRVAEKPATYHARKPRSGR